MQKYLLEIVVFLSGFIVLTYEIIGARILGPYYGTSNYVWTAMIGIILASLSFGYYIGGRLADRKHAKIETLSNIVFFGGVAIALTYLIRKPLLEFLSLVITDIRMGSVVAATILFLPASVLLGMVSPYAVRLRIDRLDKSGSTIGTMSALGTLGSIFGTFLSGFYLIPYFGMTTLLAILPMMLFVLSAFMAPRHHFWIKFMSTLLMMMTMLTFERTEGKGMVAEIDTLYSHIRVYDRRDSYTGERLRTMGINKENHSTMSLDSDRLVNEYTRYYHLARHFFPEFQTGLMLGGAGYSFPKDYLARYPDKTIDVVEIDPGVTELAKSYFGLRDDPRMSIYHEDARVFLNNNIKKYDAIFGDAFSSWYSLPYQLATKEAVQKKYDSLSENGVVILNIISSLKGETSEFLRAEYATYKSVFPLVYVFPVGTKEDSSIQNIILVALKSSTVPSFQSVDPEIREFLSHRYMSPIPENLPILTDDYAPVDHYVSKFLPYIQ